MVSKIPIEHPSGWLAPSIHPAYARLLCAHLRNKGMALDEIFSGNSLNWEGLLSSQRFISFDQFRVLVVNAIQRTQCPWIGLEISSMIQVSAHGPLGYGAVAATTVRQAFRLVERAMATRIGLLTFELMEHADFARFVVKPTCELAELEEFIYVMLLGSFQDMLEKTSGAKATCIKTFFPFPEPDWVEQYWTRFEGVELIFCADNFVVELPAALLDGYCLTADEFAYRNAVRECEALLGTRREGGELSEQIKHLLFECGAPYPPQEEVASRFAMSCRTLIRKLKQEQSSYQGLLDEVRKELACWYLRSSKLSVEHIAERLGFQDTSNFSRVFRRWLGCTPSQFRGQINA